MHLPSVAGIISHRCFSASSAQLSSPMMTTTTTTTTYTSTTTALCQETTLGDLQKALSQSHQDVLVKNQGLLVSVAESVKEYMSQYDLSHDFNHILRVLTLSRRILDVECQDGRIEYDPIVVFLSACVYSPKPWIHAQPLPY